MRLQESGEMYLETIFVLSQEMNIVRAIDVSEHLGYSKPSVSRAVGLLKQGGYLSVEDTGNLLRDPITGRQVLVVGGDVALELTGLTQEQLRSPVESIGALPGLRLIPYRNVGNSSGFLLALRLQNVKIGKWKGSTLVAFAPEGLSSEGAYQALTGGAA